MRVHSALRILRSALGCWLPDMDLNHDKQIQSLLCYRYTIGQTNAIKVEFPRTESRLLKLDKWMNGFMDKWLGPFLVPVRLLLSAINPRIHLSTHPSI